MSEASGAAKHTAAPTKASLGIVFALLAVACFSGMDVLVKWQSATYAVVQVIFFRSVSGLCSPGDHGRLQWRLGRAAAKRHVWAHIWRSLIGLCAMSSVFAAFSLMKLADVVAIVFAAPSVCNCAFGSHSGRKGGATPLVCRCVGLHRRADYHPAWYQRIRSQQPSSRSSAQPALALRRSTCAS